MKTAVMTEDYRRRPSQTLLAPVLISFSQPVRFDSKFKFLSNENKTKQQQETDIKRIYMNSEKGDCRIMCSAINDGCVCVCGGGGGGGGQRERNKGRQNVRKTELACRCR